MRKFILVSLMGWLLAGCAAGIDSAAEDQALQATFESKEHLLLQTGNHTELIRLYKQELSKNDSNELRARLIEQYILAKDYESAEFQLGTLGKEFVATAHGRYLSARVHYAQQQYEQAHAAAELALSLEPESSDSHNLMGLICAQQMDFHNARYHFYQARRYFHDDVIIKNNLAVIDLILGDYQSVVDKLTPLHLSGQADQQVTVNLAMAHANLGQFDEVKELLGKQYTEEQLELIYHGLRTVHSPVAQQYELEEPLVVTPPVTAGKRPEAPGGQGEVMP